MNEKREIGINTQGAPGQLLRLERESKNISISEVSQRLLLSAQLIEAIENDNYSNVLARVYAEGYLRAYAQFLGLSSDDIIDRFRALDVCFDVERRVAGSCQSEDCKIMQLVKSNSTIAVLLLVLLGLILVLVLTLVIRSVVGAKTSETELLQSHGENLSTEIDVEKSPVNQEAGNVEEEIEIVTKGDKNLDSSTSTETDGAIVKNKIGKRKLGQKDVVVETDDAS